VRAGHERVLRARFADAQFFWETDQKCRLADYLPKLAHVTYERRLGSYFDKVDRMRAIARWLAEQWFSSGITGGDVAGSDRAAELAKCDLVTEIRPEIVSFHFGLPDKNLLLRVKSTGAKVLSSATSVDEARWLEDQGCDAIIAQGFEAGGHRGMFLTEDVSTQVGTMALVPQVVDAVRVPVIAAGGIADARGILAAFALGAAAVQIGTAYLYCPEAQVSPRYRQALKGMRDNETAITNVFTGRPARAIVNRFMREVGPMSDVAPEFPLAASTVAPLRAKSEMAGSADFTPFWSGQAASLGRELPAAELTKQLAAEALENLKSLQTVACGA